MWQVELVDMVKQEDRVGSIGLQVKQVAGQKQVILSGLKTGLSQLGCGSGWIDPYFSHDIYIYIFFLIKKTTCICHLESHATNYLM